MKESAGVLKDKKAAGEGGPDEGALKVPDYFEADELGTSSIIVTRMTQQMKATPTEADLLRNPYIFGSITVLRRSTSSSPRATS